MHRILTLMLLGCLISLALARSGQAQEQNELRQVIEDLRQENRELREQVQYLHSQFGALIEFLICDEVIDDTPDILGRVDWDRWSRDCSQWRTWERGEEEWNIQVPELMRRYFASELRDEPWATEVETMLHNALSHPETVLSREEDPQIREMWEMGCSRLLPSQEGSISLECRTSMCHIVAHGSRLVECAFEIIMNLNIREGGSGGFRASDTEGEIWIYRQGYPLPSRETLLQFTDQEP